MLLRLGAVPALRWVFKRASRHRTQWRGNQGWVSLPSTGLSFSVLAYCFIPPSSGLRLVHESW